MSKYTTEIRYICESKANSLTSKGYESIDNIIEEARGKIFDFDYPIFDEAYKPILEKKILKHYYTREIGEETYGLWKLRLSSRMNEIMPYYNKLYTTTTLEFNPLYDFDMTTTGSRNKEDNSTEETTNTGAYETGNEYTGSTTTSGTSNNTSSGAFNNSGSGSNINKYSDTPQGAITGLDQDRYITNASKDNSTTETEGTNSSTSNTTDTSESSGTSNTNVTNTHNDTGTKSSTLSSTDDYLIRVTGSKSGTTYAKKIMEYRDSILNIDMLIIDNLNDLFFGLW